MNFINLAFVMTDKCNAACNMCCFSCSPQKNTVLDKDLIKDYIRQAKEYGTFKTISFSGGEAILYYEQLKECVAFAKGLGFNSTLVTNGFWGANYDKGYTMISALAEVGLTDLSISVDQFHQEYVPIQAVKNAIRISERLGILSALTLMDLKDGKSSCESMEKLRPEIYGKDLIVYPVFPAGEAIRHIPEEQLIKVCHKDTAVCPYDNDIIVLFDGTVMMCCTQFSQEISMTHLGNYTKTSLREAMEAFKNNDFLYVLLANQFKWYVDLAKKLGFELEENYSVACHLCYTLFTKADFVKAVKPYVKAEVDRIRMSKLFGRDH